jgi:hypothetical protein
MMRQISHGIGENDLRSKYICTSFQNLLINQYSFQHKISGEVIIWIICAYMRRLGLYYSVLSDVTSEGVN